MDSDQTTLTIPDFDVKGALPITAQYKGDTRGSTTEIQTEKRGRRRSSN